MYREVSVHAVSVQLVSGKQTYALHMQVEEERQGEEDAMLEDVAPLSREHPPLQFMGKAYKVPPVVPFRAAQGLAASDGQTNGVIDFEPEADMISFAPVHEEEDKGTPAMFAPVGKGGGQRKGVIIGTASNAGNYPLVVLQA